MTNDVMSKASDVPNKTDYSKQKVSVEEYLEYQGHEIGKANSGGFSLVDDYDSLFVNLETNTFTWYSHNTGGGIFKLMSELDNITDYDEQRNLLYKIKSERDSEYVPKTYSPTQKKAFNIADFEIDTLSEKSKEYLTQVRKIHPLIVDSLAKTGFLVDQKKKIMGKNNKEFEVRNMLYLWKDAYGQPVGADAQATKKTKGKGDDKHQGYWKGILPNSPASKHGFTFKVGPKKDVPDKLVVVEAPIDAISYWQMHLKEYKQDRPQVAFLSLSGVKSSVLDQYIKNNYYNADKEKFELPKEIHFAVDNDDAGRKLVKQYGGMLENFGAFDEVEKIVDVPADLTVKDWNDQLRYGKTLETKSVFFSEIDSVPLFSKPEVLDKKPDVPKEPNLEKNSVSERTDAPDNTIKNQSRNTREPRSDSMTKKGEPEVVNAELLAKQMQMARQNKQKERSR